MCSSAMSASAPARRQTMLGNSLSRDHEACSIYTTRIFLRDTQVGRQPVLRYWRWHTSRAGAALPTSGLAEPAARIVGGDPCVAQGHGTSLLAIFDDCPGTCRSFHVIACLVGPVSPVDQKTKRFTIVADLDSLLPSTMLFIPHPSFGREGVSDP